MSEPEQELQPRHLKAAENLRGIRLRISLLPEGDQAMIAGLASQVLDCVDAAGGYGMLLLSYVGANFAAIYAENEQALDANLAATLMSEEEIVTRARAGLLPGIKFESEGVVSIDADEASEEDTGALMAALSHQQPQAQAQPEPPADNVFYVDGHGTTRRTLN